MSATRPGQIDPIHGQAKPSKLRQRRKRRVSAHAAAVEAMAGAMCADAGSLAQTYYHSQATVALRALVESPEVREAIAASFHGFNSLGECECGFATERSPEVMRQHQADVILAALTEGGAGGG